MDTLTAKQKRIVEWIAKVALFYLVWPLVLAILSSSVHNWEWVRMRMPFGQQQKAEWNIEGRLDDIELVLQETDPQHLVQDLRWLYPMLEPYGVAMPDIDPWKTGDKHYDETWVGFHRTFLKVMHRQIRSGEFVIEEWNADVERESTKRRNWLQRNGQIGEEGADRRGP